MSGPALFRDFSGAAARPSEGKGKKAPAPFSIRFTDEERAWLEKDAGTLSLAAYIRLKLFAGE